MTLKFSEKFDHPFSHVFKFFNMFPESCGSLLCRFIRCFKDVNVRVLWKGLELPSANGGRFEINQLLFADDTALVSDSEVKLCRLVSEFCIIC